MYKLISKNVFQGLRSQDPTNTQILRPRGATQAEDLHRFVARSLVKRSPDMEDLADTDDMGKYSCNIVFKIGFYKDKTINTLAFGQNIT